MCTVDARQIQYHNNSQDVNGYQDLWGQRKIFPEVKLSAVQFRNSCKQILNSLLRRRIAADSGII
jgi:hypothetical protein